MIIIINTISAIVVGIALIFSVYLVSRYALFKNIDTSICEDEFKEYQDKMKQVYLKGVIIFLFVGIFGYLFNCSFLEFNDRLKGATQYITFFIIYVILLWISNKNQKFKIKKLNLKREKYIITLIIYICLISTILIYLFSMYYK